MLSPREDKKTKQNIKLLLMLIVIVIWPCLSSKLTWTNSIFASEFGVLLCLGPYNTKISPSKASFYLVKQSSIIDDGGIVISLGYHRQKKNGTHEQENILSLQSIFVSISIF